MHGFERFPGHLVGFERDLFGQGEPGEGQPGGRDQQRLLAGEAVFQDLFHQLTGFFEVATQQSQLAFLRQNGSQQRPFANLFGQGPGLRQERLGRGRLAHFEQQTGKVCQRYGLIGFEAGGGAGIERLLVQFAGRFEFTLKA